MKNRLTLLFAFFVSLTTFQAQAQEDTIQAGINKAYHALVAQRDATKDLTAQNQVTLYLALIQPFVNPDALPAYFIATNETYFRSNRKEVVVAEWLAYNQGLLMNQLTMDDEVPVKVDSFDETRILNHPAFESTPGVKWITLKMQPAFSRSMELIRKRASGEFLISARAEQARLRTVTEQYRNKYFNGYRNRNFLEYFVEGTYWNYRARKAGKNGALTAPSRHALILLANPFIAVASNSLDGFKTNNSNLYALLPVLGMDFFCKDFKNFAGVSIVSASPISPGDPLINGSMIGLEVHYNNTINLGWALGNAILGGEKSSQVSQKIFLSVALFNRYFKKTP